MITKKSELKSKKKIIQILKSHVTRVRSLNMLVYSFRRSNDLYALPRYMKYWMNTVFENKKSIYNQTIIADQFWILNLKSRSFASLQLNLNELYTEKKVKVVQEVKARKIKSRFLKALSKNMIKKREKRKNNLLMRCFFAWKE